MKIDNKAELLFILIVFLTIPTLYIVNTFVNVTKYKSPCTPVIYVDSGLSPDVVESIERNDTKICSLRCNSYCTVQLGGPCKGVLRALYSDIYGISCVCELYPVDKEYADDCLDENEDFKTANIYELPGDEEASSI